MQPHQTANCGKAEGRFPWGMAAGAVSEASSTGKESPKRGVQQETHHNCYLLCRRKGECVCAGEEGRGADPFHGELSGRRLLLVPCFINKAT